MNLDKKLELAQEWYIKHSEIPCFIRADVEYAWQYADAMEVEYNKRKQTKAKKDAEDAKVFFDKLVVADSPQLDFQVDWSVAPEWANYWIKTSGKSYARLGDKPEISEIIPHWNIECIQKTFAPSFDYEGDWKDSLRMRP